MTTQRASATIAATKAGKVYTNNHSGPQVVTLSVHSDKGTTNPTINVAIDSVSTRSLNFVGTKGTLSQNPVLGEMDLALPDGGSPYATNRVTMNTSGTRPAQGANGNYYTSFNNNYVRDMAIDPYFWVNPSAFNGKTDTRYPWSYGGTAYLFYAGTAKTTRDQYIENRLNPATYGQSSGTSLVSQGYSYDGYARGQCLYTDTVINIQSNAYMGGIEFTSSSSTNTGTRTSDSFYYQFTQGGYNPSSYDIDDVNRILQPRADGGMYVMDMHPNSNSNYTQYLGFIDAMTYKGGEGKWSNTNVGSFNDLISYNQVYHAKAHMRNESPLSSGNIKVSWHKYNPANKKFYFLFYNSNSDYNGIWEATRESIFPGSSLNSGNSHTTIGSWATKVAEATGLDGTFNTTQPQQIGASLWVVFSGNTSYYSTNLINWKTAPDFIGVSEASDAIVAFELNGVNVFARSGSPSLFGSSSGFSGVEAAGRLETGTAVGVYERNGLILNSGDSIYLENLDLSTSVHSTVMALDV